MAVDTEGFSRVLRELGVAGGGRASCPSRPRRAGHPHTVVPTTFAELLRITAGTPAAVGD